MHVYFIVIILIHVSLITTLEEFTCLIFGPEWTVMLFSRISTRSMLQCSEHLAISVQPFSGKVLVFINDLIIFNI